MQGGGRLSQANVTAMQAYCSPTAYMSVSVEYAPLSSTVSAAYRLCSRVSTNFPVTQCQLHFKADNTFNGQYL